MMETPEKDELVIATIRKIFPYGAFCSLDEYDNKEAFVHISEVASRWVKNIHEFLKENQKVVARVHNFLPEKNQIDLSMRRVSEAEKKLKLEEVKRKKRAASLLVVLAKRLKKDPKVFSNQMTPILEKEFGEVMDAFEQISAEPEESLKIINLPEETTHALRELATQNVKKPKVQISKILEISCPKPDGVDIIKRVLNLFESTQPKKIGVCITYLGAPKYKLSITADDYKTAEKTVSAMVEQASDDLKKSRGSITVVGETK